MTHIHTNTVQEIVAQYKGKTRQVVEIALQQFIEIERERGEAGQILRSSTDTHKLLYPYFMGLEIEHFYIACLNRRNKVINVHKISEGSNSSCLADPQTIAKKALSVKGCSALILAHNHPSGSNKPSAEDIAITDKLKKALGFLDIQVHDHYIYAGMNHFYSFADEGMI